MKHLQMIIVSIANLLTTLLATTIGTSLSGPLKCTKEAHVWRS